MRRTVVALAAVCALSLMAACRPLADKNTTAPSAGATRQPAGNKYPNTSKPDLKLPTRTHVPCLEGWTPSIQRNTCQKESDVDGCVFLDLTNLDPDDEYRFFCDDKKDWQPITKLDRNGTWVGVKVPPEDLSSLCYGKVTDTITVACGDGFRAEG